MLEARRTSDNFYLHLTRWTVDGRRRFALRLASRVRGGCGGLSWLPKFLLHTGWQPAHRKINKAQGAIEPRWVASQHLFSWG